MKPLSITSTLLPVVTASRDCQPHVELDSGPVLGTTVNLPLAVHAVNSFRGIPYAQPPGRFAVSLPPDPWTEPLNATEFQPSCVQLFVQSPLAPGLDLLKGIFNDNAPESEDCLYINAFAPATTPPDGGWPVVLFIHGGGFQQGHGRIDLSGFAAYENTVAFSFNYRTNIFGFPHSPDVPIKERNLGILDQRLAIEWVQKNVAAFGGDPTKVTIWGQSAGSLSVDAHLVAYGEAEDIPFRAAILSSGQMSWGSIAMTAQPDAYDSWNNLSQALNCPGSGEAQMECMKTANATEMTDLMGPMGLAFSPLRDNVTVLSKPAARRREGKAANVPILTGTTAQEGRGLVNRAVSLDFLLDTYLGDPLMTKQERDALVAAYRKLPGIEDDFDVAAAIHTEFAWQCPQHILANTSASLGNPTWRYYFNTSIADFFPDEYQWLGKFHGSDVALLFTLPSTDIDGLPLSPQQYAVANSFRAALGRFIRNPVGGPGWPAVGSRFEPFGVANIGDLGAVPEGLAAGATPVDRTSLDERCAFYADLYPLMEAWMS